MDDNRRPGFFRIVADATAYFGPMIFGSILVMLLVAVSRVLLYGWSLVYWPVYAVYVWLARFAQWIGGSS